MTGSSGHESDAGHSRLPSPCHEPCLPQAEHLFEPAAACDTAVDRCDAHMPPRDLPIARILHSRQCLSAGLLRRWDDVHAGPRERLKAQVGQPLTPRR
jgi:hypothetical protein